MKIPAIQLEQQKKEFIKRCTLCGKCIQECQIHPYWRFADEDPVELQKSRIDFLKGGEFSQTVYDMVWDCMDCGYCADICPEGLDPTDIVALIKVELRRRGHPLPDGLLNVGKWSVLPDVPCNYYEVLSSLLLNPSQTRWLTKVPDSPEHADVVYFLGCGLHIRPDLLFTSLDILDRMDLNYVALGGIAFCCGTIYNVAGRAAEAEKHYNRLVDAISAFTPETVVTFCPGCSAVLGAEPQLFSDPQFRHIHISTLIGENVDRLKFEKPIEKVVTIHDPCALRQTIGEFEGARKVLKAIPGIQLVEMEHWGKNTICCGSGSVDSEAGKKVGRCRMEEAKKAGADVLVTICVGCDEMYQSLAQDYPFEVMNLMTLVGRALGIEYEDKMSKYSEWGDVDRIIEDARTNIEASKFPEQEIRAFLEEFLKQ